MKKISIITLSLSLLSAILVSGCGGKDAPFTIDAGGHTGSSGDATVVPGRTETISEGTAGSEEAILPSGTDSATSDEDAARTGSEDSADATPPVGTPPATTPPARTFSCRNPEPLADFPGFVHCVEGYCKNLATEKRVDCPYGIPEGMERPATPTVEAPDSGILYGRLPEDIASRIRGGLLLPAVPSQHDQDVTHLMNDTFQPGEFTAYEQEVQARVISERAAITPEGFRGALKDYVVAILKALIDAERNNAGVFAQRTTKLGQVIAAFKSGDFSRSREAVNGGELSSSAVYDAIPNDSDMLKKAGSYLEIQFAEAMKDCAKASFDARQEVREQSSLVQGGEGLFLVYKPDGIIDSGWNHIRGFDFADFWYEGSSNWRGLTEGIRSALNAELHPVDAAAAARALEEMGRQIRDQADRTADAIGRW